MVASLKTPVATLETAAAELKVTVRAHEVSNCCTAMLSASTITGMSSTIG